MNKILVIQTAFIGDAILATALLESLHAEYPQAEIDFLVRKGNEGLFHKHPFLHELIVWNKQTAKYKDWWRILRHIRRRRYDAVINVQRFAATGLWTALSGAAFTAGFNKNPFSFAFRHRVAHHFDRGMHEIERNHQLIAPLVSRQTPQRPRLYPSADDYARVAHYQSHSPYVCVAPASVWFTKQYPEHKWVAFLQALPPSLTVYLLGGPADYALCERIRSAVKERPIHNLAGKLSLLQSAALMQKALMNYANDSSPLHLASAMNAPITAVYCSTIPGFGFYPVSEQSHIVETQGLLPCRPCGIHGHKQCPKGHFRCAESIETAQLTACLPPLPQ
ncbi:glycosyltransferase family 9 protein [Thermonema rossianum]|uniref:glycosyltransferase family 9 protein n=1 Tax=Thermonema rossianum TaxID=55505 RepID=UPI0005706142|nr:glycosyltransferase family 9 protein [Thermonema rossianum]